jgi:hypothetical protein
MSQNPGNKQSENQGNSGRGSENQTRKRSAEGFEGMNYEQVRQPYNSGNSNSRNRDDIENDSEGKRRDEL